MASAPGPLLYEISSSEGATSLAIPMEREFRPFEDMVSLWRLYRTMRTARPEVVDVSTPKAGLLGSVAAVLAGVPCRVYTMRGLRLETTAGFKRAALWATEWIACWCSHRVVCASPSLRARAVGLNLVSPAKARILEKGSGGVDARRFSLSTRSLRETEDLRGTLGIPRDVPVVGYVGRLVKDKGIRELVEAFQRLRATYPTLRLLLVGDFEPGDPVEPEVRRYIEVGPSIVRPGVVGDTAPYYPLMDVLALPTYREGFPGVPMEAQASGVPVVTTTATGAVDSILDGVTGLLVPVGDAIALANAISKLLADPVLRVHMGNAGRARVERDFRVEAIWSAMADLYRDLMEEKLDPPQARSGGKISWEKRFFDLVVATSALVLLSPLMAVLAILIRSWLGSPVVFRQQRPGWHGKLFTCLKFRTMNDARDADGRLLPDGDRMTTLGRFLRLNSLDELPELINVLRGEMSLVGPRPLLPQYLDRYTPEQMRRHAVRPGITGWAQVNGRNSLDWGQKFALDLWYVDNQSLRLDVRILARTAWQVLRRADIAQCGHATMPEFAGEAVRRTENMNDAK